MKFTIYASDVRGKQGNCLYPYRREITSAAELKAAAAYDHVCAEYKDSYRKNDNFLLSDCVVMDVDNDHSDNPADWITPESLADEYEEIGYAITYSRHHMKEKDGKSARPKFHVYFRIKPAADAVAYKRLKENIYRTYPFYDGNALDAGRFIYGCDAGDVIWHDGEKTIESLIARETRTDRYTIPEGKRNATMSRFAGRVVKRYGVNDASHQIFLDEADKCDPPLKDEELAKIWNSAGKFAGKVALEPGYVPPDQFNAAVPKGPAGSLMPEDYSDIGQAKVLKKEYGDEIAFNAATDFFQYDGAVWNESREAALGATMEFLDLQLADAQLLLFKTKQALINAGGGEALTGGKKAVNNLDDDQMKLMEECLVAKSYFGFVMQRRNIRFIRSAMEAVKPYITVPLEELNGDPLLLNTPESTYRLADGLAGRQEHDWKDYCTKMTAVEPGYDGRDLWLSELDKTFLGDQELISYVQEVVGLAAIGKVYKEAMIIAYGEGRNGKSTFWNTVSRVLGTYSGDVSADTLTVGCRRNVKPEMAELKGVRLALAKELEEGMRLNTSVVKQLTSTDKIFGEKKYCKPASFTPSHTLVLYTNHLPRVGATDEGTWRRLIVIPFNAIFTGKNDHKNYADFLFENAGPYILTWIIEGAQRIIRKGYHLTNPKVVQDAVDAYRNQNDWMAEFLEECCEVDPSYTEKSGELYQEYRAYCMRMGEFSRSTTDFYSALDQRGFMRKHTNKGTIVRGLRIKSDFAE